jgi:hypothetical protein
MDDELLTLKEFAKRSHYALQTVYNKISTGQLNGEHGLVKLPHGRHRVDWAMWTAWLRARRERGAAPTVSAK